jgi:hypothetical protein
MANLLEIGRDADDTQQTDRMVRAGNIFQLFHPKPSGPFNFITANEQQEF